MKKNKKPIDFIATRDFTIRESEEGDSTAGKNTQNTTK